MIVASYTIKIGNNLEIYCNLWLSLMILKISDVRFPKKLPKISRAATLSNIYDVWLITCSTHKVTVYTTNAHYVYYQWI